MTTGWWMAPGQPRRPRRRRRLALLGGLALLFGASATAGWAFADPAAFGSALDGVAHLAPMGVAPAAAAPGPSGGPAATASPGGAAAASPTPRVTEAPTPTPTASPRPLPSRPAESGARRSSVDGGDGSIAPSPGRRRPSCCRAWRRPSSSPMARPGTVLRAWPTWRPDAPVEPGTPFAAASVTKTFTSALILRYVDQGLVKLDDRLARWLPEWPNARKITIRMLLNHTSGIPRLLPQPEARPRPEQGQDAVLDGRRDPGVLCPEGSGLPARQGLVVLEHELPPPR